MSETNFLNLLEFLFVIAFMGLIILFVGDPDIHDIIKDSLQNSAHCSPKNQVTQVE